MPRKGENIYKRKDGRWEARYIKGRNDDGSIHYGYVYAKSYKEAKQKKSTIQSANTIKDNKKDLINANDFANWSEQWLSHKQNRIKISSYAKYSNLLSSYIIPFLGEKELETINSYAIEIWIDALISTGGNNGNGVSEKTASDAISVVKSILRYANQINPILKIQKIDVSIKHTASELHILSRDDQSILTKYIIENPNRKNLGILICLYSGIRIGELCALKMSDINIEQRYLYIHSTMQRIKNYEHENDTSKSKTQVIIISPKSKSSIRRIPIPANLVDIIKDFVSTKDDEFFLTGALENFIEPRVIQYHFKKILKKCNIESTNFHSIRHTFATRCVELGFDIKTLSEILGHASVNITMNRYVHPSMDLKRSNMNLLTELLAVK